MKTVIMIATISIGLFLGCNTVIETNTVNTPLFSSVKTDGIVYSLSVPTTQFDLFDTLRGTFQVINKSSRERQFNFGNMQQLGFQLVNAHGSVALFAPVVVSPALSNLHLRAGEKKEYSILWLFKDRNDQYIGRGNYTLSAFLLDGNSPSVSLTIRVK